MRYIKLSALVFVALLFKQSFETSNAELLPQKVLVESNENSFNFSALAPDIKLLEEAAQSGDAVAQTELGQLLWREADDQEQIKESIQWFEKAANQGELEAQFWLGLLTLGKRQDALDWLVSAAEQGHTGAAYFAGENLLSGLKVERDEALGSRLMIQAAREGQAMASFQLAQFYFGKGDHESAFLWSIITSYSLPDIGKIFIDLSAPHIPSDRKAIIKEKAQFCSQTGYVSCQ